MVNGKLVAAVAALVLAGTPAMGPLPGHAAQRGTAPPPAGRWRNAPEYVRLFAPARAHTEAYHAYVSPLALEDVLSQLEHDAAVLHPPGAWAPLAVLASDAFGRTGTYDRAKVARLYGARRVGVARGPLGEDGRPTQAWTLISPYPDQTAEHLEPGTLLIVLNLAGTP